MPSEEEASQVSLVRLEGKIDALSAKLDGRLDAVMAKIEAGDRESLQLFELQKSEMGHVAAAVQVNTARIAAVATESAARDAELEKHIAAVQKDLDAETARRDAELEARVVALADHVKDFDTVKRLVFGVVGLILVGVVVAILALVINNTP